MRGPTFMITAGCCLAAATSAIADEDYAGTWHCDRNPAVAEPVKNALDELAPNIGVRRAIFEYMRRWDAQEMMRQCEAFASGAPHDISCLNGRRDWDAIKSMVPSEIFGMSAGQTRPHFLALQAEDHGQSAAIEYCQDVGAIAPQQGLRMHSGK